MAISHLLDMNSNGLISFGHPGMRYTTVSHPECENTCAHFPPLMHNPCSNDRLQMGITPFILPEEVRRTSEMNFLLCIRSLGQTLLRDGGVFMPLDCI